MGRCCTRCHETDRPPVVRLGRGAALCAACLASLVEGRFRHALTVARGGRFAPPPALLLLSYDGRPAAVAARLMLARAEAARAHLLSTGAPASAAGPPAIGLYVDSSALLLAPAAGSPAAESVVARPADALAAAAERWDGVPLVALRLSALWRTEGRWERAAVMADGAAPTAAGLDPGAWLARFCAALDDGDADGTPNDDDDGDGDGEEEEEAEGRGRRADVVAAVAAACRTLSALEDLAASLQRHLLLRVAEALRRRVAAPLVVLLPDDADAVGRAVVGGTARGRRLFLAAAAAEVALWSDDASAADAPAMALCRPLARTTARELAVYLRLQGVDRAFPFVPSLATGRARTDSIDALVADFLARLQGEHEQTLPTLGRMAERMRDAAPLRRAALCPLCLLSARPDAAEDAAGRRRSPSANNPLCNGCKATLEETAVLSIPFPPCISI